MEDVLASLLDRRQEGVERRSQHIAELNHRAAETDTASTVVRIIGYAMSDGAADDVISYQIAPGILTKPSA